MAKRTLIYAGIGPRDTPPEVLQVMTNIAGQMGPDWFLSSGYGRGADQAFSIGAPANRQVQWVPYDSIHTGSFFVRCPLPNSPEGRKQRAVAAWHHPFWERMKESTKGLMTRNVPIVLGETASVESIVDLLIYWQTAEKDKSEQSGTNHTRRIAMNYGIPSFNIRLENEQDALMAKIEELEKNNV